MLYDGRVGGYHRQLRAAHSPSGCPSTSTPGSSGPRSWGGVGASGRPKIKRRGDAIAMTRSDRSAAMIFTGVEPRGARADSGNHRARCAVRRAWILSLPRPPSWSTPSSCSRTTSAGAPSSPRASCSASPRRRSRPPLRGRVRPDDPALVPAGRVAAGNMHTTRRVRDPRRPRHGNHDRRAALRRRSDLVAIWSRSRFCGGAS